MDLELEEIGSDYVVINDPKAKKTERIKKYRNYGKWTLMNVITIDKKKEPVAVFENHEDKEGSIVYRNKKVIICELPKSLEFTKDLKDPSYWEHKLKEVRNDPRDFLAEDILSKKDDPCYKKVAESFPPIGKIKHWESGQECIVTFIGSQNCIDKVGIFYGGRTSTFNPIAVAPEIREVIENEKVLEGIVGDWLPILRFIYPVGDRTFWEMIIFGEVKPSSFWIQPVWYRLTKIKEEMLEKVEYYRSYLSSRDRIQEEDFYKEMLKVWEEWNNILKPAMKIEVPETRVSHFCKHSLVRIMITRINDHPKYGVFDRHYGGSEHDGFPDTFTASVDCLLEWGLLRTAKKYINNYFTEFVQHGGSVNYRGPETGQYSRILAVLAKYYNYTNDYKIFLKHEDKIRGIEDLLLSLREKAKKLPPNDPSYGMIFGWSEADSCLFPEPEKYNQPYFSNSTEACRGFYDIGNAWMRIGERLSRPEFVNRGRKLIEEARELKKDILASIEKSILKNKDFVHIPAIAGAKRPYDEDIKEDPLCPQQFAPRAYCEMLHSGILPASIVEIIIKYNSTHGGSVLGIPGFYGGGWLGGESYSNRTFLSFLAYRYAYGLIQSNKIQEFLLLYYALMSHCHTRGTWTAFEFGILDEAGGKIFAPYCVPAQVTIPLLTKWMLVFEDPNLPILRLGQAIPRTWLENNKKIIVCNAPSRWGNISYEINSKINEGKIFVNIKLPKIDSAAEVILFLRVPQRHWIRKVLVNDENWPDYSSDKEIIHLPARLLHRKNFIEVKYDTKK